MRTIRYSMLLALLFVEMAASAQTFHVITMFDTNDQNIGASMKTERMMVINEMQTIAGYFEEFGYDCSMDDYYGNNCGKAQLMQAVGNLDIGSDDIVLFYYGGHGARAYNNSSDRFPQMCLGERSETNWVPSTLIKNMIMKKNPRLTIVLTGCCNKETAGVTIKSIVAQSQGYTSQSEVNKNAFKNLFLGSRGVVQLTSSRAGEYSWCGMRGSMFCLALLDVLDGVGKGLVRPDWHSVCDDVKNRVSIVNIPTSDGIAKQNPDYEVAVNAGNIPRTDDGTSRRDDNGTTIKHNVNNDADSGLMQDIARLLDKSADRNSRLLLIPDILSKYFASGAKVLTLGRDMKTVVDYEDAEVFLRRIAMSPYISQINIIEQGDGKSSLIRVHEVRTK